MEDRHSDTDPDKKHPQYGFKMGQRLNTIVNAMLRGRYSFLLVIVLIAYFWHPALFAGKTIIHGDSIIHGLPLYYAHTESIFGSESILWSNGMYGGHPLFAEGQGGFANPLNMIIASLFSPILGHQLAYILGLMIAASGVFVLARQLKISYWGATFAAMAASFSTSWILCLHSYTPSATMAWIPWIMVAAEYWIKHPSSISAIFLALPTSLSILAGYPQYPYGAVIYVMASLCALPFSPEARVNIKVNWKTHLWSGSLAVLLFIGLTAVQVFPLIELIGQSHRSEGIRLLNTDWSSILWVKNLLLYDASDTTMASMGSLMITGLAIGALFMKMPNRIFGHLIATLLLFNLGLQDASPVFNLIYKFHLIPGLHYNQHMVIFLCVAVIGFSLLAAFFIDATSKSVIPFRCEERIRKIAAMTLLAVLSCVLAVVVTRIFDKAGFIIQILTFIISFSFVFILRKKGFARFIPLALTIVLFSECLLLKTHVFHFAPPSIAIPPKEVQSILKDPLLHEYKTRDSSLAWLGGFLHPMHPDLELGAERQIHALSGLTGLFFGFPSMGGALALQMDRRRILDPVLDKEVFAEQDSKFRMIDILGIKYISTSQPVNKLTFELLNFNKAHQIWIYKNKNAQPRFQIYCHAEFVNSYEDALWKLKNANRRTLFLEYPQNKKSQLTKPLEMAQNTSCENFPEKEVLSKIRYLKTNSQKYELEMDASQSGWLFLADANYPGWKATINDLPATIYSAQVLGKAVKIIPGRNHIIIEYRPRMFYIGLTITVLTVLLAMGMLIWHRINFSSSRKQTKENTHVNTAG